MLKNLKVYNKQYKSRTAFIFFPNVHMPASTSSSLWWLPNNLMVYYCPRLERSVDRGENARPTRTPDCTCGMNGPAMRIHGRPQLPWDEAGGKYVRALMRIDRDKVEKVPLLREKRWPHSCRMVAVWSLALPA